MEKEDSHRFIPITIGDGNTKQTGIMIKDKEGVTKTYLVHANGLLYEIRNPLIEDK
jgi:hypothetical protein